METERSGISFRETDLTYYMIGFTIKLNMDVAQGYGNFPTIAMDDKNSM